MYLFRMYPRKMDFLIVLCFLVLQVLSTKLYDYRTEIKVLTEEESEKESGRLSDPGLPPDNGGNYGDLIYRYRTNNDQLLIREVVTAGELSSSVTDLRWAASISGARISSVRVLNFGRERCYCLRIDVQGGDVETILRIPRLHDPRVLIEVYGY